MMFPEGCAALIRVWCGTKCDCTKNRIDVPTARDKAQALQLQVGMYWGLRKHIARIGQLARGSVVISRWNGPNCPAKAAHWRHLQEPSVVMSNWSGRSIINQYLSACQFYAWTAAGQRMARSATPAINGKTITKT